MKGESISLLGAASDALDRAEDDLRGMPLTPQVRELHGKQAALQLVVERLVFGRQPALTEAQTAKLASDVASFAREVAEVRARVNPG